MGERVLITGANGFLSGYIIRELLQAGYLVKGVVRRHDAIVPINHHRLELVTGDMRDRLFLNTILADCQMVVHCAACTDMSIIALDDYLKANVETTQFLLDAALCQGISKFIFIGTANSFASGNKDVPGNENQQMAEPFLKSGYAISKTEAMRRVLSYSDQMHVSIIAPSFMLGKGASYKGSGSIVKRAVRKRIILYPPGGKNFVHASDVAKGVVRSIGKAPNGSVYLMVNENLSYKAFYQLLSKIEGKKKLLIKIPKSVMLGMGFIGDILRFFKVKTAISSVNMRILCCHAFYTNRKSRDELNMEFTDTETFITDTLQGMIHE